MDRRDRKYAYWTIAVNREPGHALGTREVEPGAGAGIVDMEMGGGREEASWA